MSYAGSTEKLLTAGQLAKQLGTSRWTIWRWARLGLIPVAVRSSNGSLFRLCDLVGNNLVVKHFKLAAGMSAPLPGANAAEDEATTSAAESLESDQAASGARRA